MALQKYWATLKYLYLQQTVKVINKIPSMEVQDVEFILHCKMKWNWFMSVSRTFVVYISGHA